MLLGPFTFSLENWHADSEQEWRTLSEPWYLLMYVTAHTVAAWT